MIQLARSATDEHHTADLPKVTGRLSRKAGSIDHSMAATTTSSKQRQSFDDDQDPTLRNLIRPASFQATNILTEKKVPEQSKGLQEDLFLNLARSDSLGDDASKPSVKSERRRVSLALYTCLQPSNSVVGITR